jgi:hypothetical protein
VTASTGARAPVDLAAPDQRGALVWIDAREVIVVRWAEGASSVVRLASNVPAHRKSTRHVRHGPPMCGGGGSTPLTSGEPRRLEYLDRFIQEVAERLAADEDIMVIGHGTVHERLATCLRDIDARSGRARTISARRAGRLTEPQLVAELREHLGTSPPRRVVGG